MLSLFQLGSVLVARFQLHREEGQTMAEYGILIAVIAVVVIIAAALLGTNISTLFNSTAGKV